MTQDLFALAHDVVRLFRARTRKHEVFVGRSEYSTIWVVDDAEIRAFVVGDDLAASKGCQTPRSWGSEGKAFRAREHVALLALTEPKFFAQRLTSLPESESRQDKIFIEEVKTGLPMNLALDFYKCTRRDVEDARELGEKFKLSTPRHADTVRMYRYLVKLQDRLRVWQEAEAQRRVVANYEAEERRQREEAEARKAEFEEDEERDGHLLAALAEPQR